MKLSYTIPAGLHVKTAGTTRILYPNGDGHYRAEHADTGRVEIRSYSEVLGWLRRPDCSTSNAIPDSFGAARVRHGGLQYRQQLSEDLQDQINLRKAIIAGVDYLAETGVKITAARGKPVEEGPKTQVAVLETP